MTFKDFGYYEGEFENGKIFGIGVYKNGEKKFEG